MIEIIGKNGSGKSYIAKELYKNGFKINIGYTTRSKRINEKDGIDYFFIDKSEFENKIHNGEFADYKLKNNNYYGILKRDLTENSILVSGDSKKIEQVTGIKIKKVYLNCDMITRFERVSMRKEPLINTFDRFHSENFSFLYDFDAIFIDNTNNPIVNLLEQFKIIDNLPLIANRLFIEEEVKKYALEKKENTNNKLLTMLKYEEFLLRMFFLNNKVLNNDIIIASYYHELSMFAKSIGIESYLTNDGLIAAIDNQEYNFNYLEKRLLK